MLGYYLKFNGADFPNPASVSMTSDMIENVSQSEAGTDLVTMVRPSKKTWNFTFNLSSAKKDVLKGLCLLEYVTMVYMGTTYTVRLRGYQDNLVENSEWAANTDGLFTVSVKAMEF